MSDPRFEAGNPFTDADIKRIERWLGRKLPKSYCDFVKEYGAAFVGGYVNGSKPFLITYFLDSAIKGAFFSDRRETIRLRSEGLFPIAECFSLELYVMDLGDSSVHHIDYGWGQRNVRKVAESFQGFIDGIVSKNDESLIDDGAKEVVMDDDELNEEGYTKGQVRALNYFNMNRPMEVEGVKGNSAVDRDLTREFVSAITGMSRREVGEWLDKHHFVLDYLEEGKMQVIPERIHRGTFTVSVQ